jgi:hypothetical protein
VCLHLHLGLNVFQLESGCQMHIFALTVGKRKKHARVLLASPSRGDGADLRTLAPPHPPSPPPAAPPPELAAGIPRGREEGGGVAVLLSSRAGRGGRGRSAPSARFAGSGRPPAAAGVVAPYPTTPCPDLGPARRKLVVW